MERLEAQICELAGDLTAATCRFLILLADFDERRGWASWEMPSCAGWLSWKCQMSSGTAREHVRVARALPGLPVIRREFAAGRLSYAKVRALTRIATPATDASLAEIAHPMTGNQLERFARAHRKVSTADDQTTQIRRRLSWRQDDDGSLSGTFRLPPLEGHTLLKALKAALEDLKFPDGNERPGPTTTHLADALTLIAETFLGEKIAKADNPELYQVVVHAGPEAFAAPAENADVSAETPASSQRPPGHPADPARCHIEDGPALSVTTAQMVACQAVLSWMIHDHDGSVLDVGRKHRRATAALRRAARERDKCRCRFPGCESRRVDLHHIQYWINGGRTELTNLIGLCPYHHRIVHDLGYLISSGPGGSFTFTRPDGTVLPASPGLPSPDGTIETCHDADITPDTIIPPWYGERLDLDHAIYIHFANNRTPEERQREREQEAELAKVFRPNLDPHHDERMSWIRKVAADRESAAAQA